MSQIDFSAAGSVASRDPERELREAGWLEEDFLKAGGARLLDLIRSYKIGLAETFVRSGANVLFSDENGMTALHHAASRGMRSVVLELIKSGHCDYLARDVQGRYAFDLAIEGGRDYALARLLLKKQMRQASLSSLPAYEPPLRRNLSNT